MKFSRLFVVILAAMVTLFAGCATTAKKEKNKKAPSPKAEAKTIEKAVKKATTPTVFKRHIKRLEAKKVYAEKNKDNIKVIMLGDSITHQWEYKQAAQANAKYITPYNVLNLGCNGIHTQHTIWIIEKLGIIDNLDPKLITVMIGTNNRGHYKGTVAGIKHIVDSLRQRFPEAKILLYAIFPRGKDNNDKRRIENEKVNAEIVNFCDNKNVIWVDIRKNFLTEDGILEKSVMPDLLHPRNTKGYSIWGESLKPYFEKYAK